MDLDSARNLYESLKMLTLLIHDTKCGQMNEKESKESHEG